LEIDPKKLLKVLHFDGTPITARFIINAIMDQLPSRMRAGATPVEEAVK
jgi:2-oxoglutarate ferredoxin oxidoreductase subunit alpha